MSQDLLLTDGCIKLSQEPVIAEAMDEGTLSDARVPNEHHFKDAVWGTAGCFQCLELQQKKRMWAGKNPPADSTLQLEFDGKRVRNP